MTEHEKQMEKYRESANDVLLDFDGTIAEFSYPELGPPRKGALEFVRWLVARGLRPVIWSSRMSRKHSDDAQAEAEANAIAEWLERFVFPRQCIVDLGLVGKRLALAYLDDRGVACDDSTPWDDVKARVLHIKEREDARWAEYDKERQG